jgi:hypothetical protein
MARLRSSLMNPVKSESPTPPPTRGVLEKRLETRVA